MCSAGTHVAYLQQPTFTYLSLDVKGILLTDSRLKVGSDRVHSRCGSGRVRWEQWERVGRGKRLGKRFRECGICVCSARVKAKFRERSAKHVLIKSLPGRSRIVRTIPASYHDWCLKMEEPPGKT